MGRTTRTIEVCDICRREAVAMTTCIVCKCEYCCTCRSFVPGCWVQPNLCQKCCTPERLAVVRAYGTTIGTLVRERDAKLAAKGETGGADA